MKFKEHSVILSLIDKSSVKIGDSGIIISVYPTNNYLIEFDNILLEMEEKQIAGEEEFKLVMKKNKEDLLEDKINSYIFEIGVPQSKLKELCHSLGRREEELYKWLIGQTTCINSKGESEIYPWDLIRFFENRPVID